MWESGGKGEVRRAKARRREVATLPYVSGGDSNRAEGSTWTPAAKGNRTPEEGKKSNWFPVERESKEQGLPGMMSRAEHSVPGIWLKKEGNNMGSHVVQQEQFNRVLCQLTSTVRVWFLLWTKDKLCFWIPDLLQQPPSLGIGQEEEVRVDEGPTQPGKINPVREEPATLLLSELATKLFTLASESSPSFIFTNRPTD